MELDSRDLISVYCKKRIIPRIITTSCRAVDIGTVKGKPTYQVARPNNLLPHLSGRTFHLKTIPARGIPGKMGAEEEEIVNKFGTLTINSKYKKTPISKPKRAQKSTKKKHNKRKNC